MSGLVLLILRTLHLFVLKLGRDCSAGTYRRWDTVSLPLTASLIRGGFTSIGFMYAGTGYHLCLARIIIIQPR